MAATRGWTAGLPVIYLALFLLVPTACFRKDMVLQFRRHALVQPRVYSKDGREKRETAIHKGEHKEKLTVAFVAFGKEFLLNLQMNKNLLPRNYFEKHDHNGSHVINKPMEKSRNHCHYQGHVQDHKNSWIALSTCFGISGVIYDGSELHYIEPAPLSTNYSHLVFKAADLKQSNFTCGVKDSQESVRAHVLNRLLRHRRSPVFQDPYRSNGKSRYVELIIVNDNKEFKEFNKDKDAVFERSKQIANIVNGLYSPLNIFIALVGVIVWSEKDEIALSSDGDSTLTNFLHYRRERLAQEHPNDNAQLITAMTFDGGVVGKALKGPICTYEYSGGVNMDHSQVVGLVATTVAHELGHNFGMEHDTDECQCPDDKCIMAPSSSSTSPRHWSSCSRDYLRLAYDQGMDYCLRNRPSDIIGPVCGNGFLEKGEECDCGLKEFCDNFCCNASSCQLFPNASCAMGGCCDTKTCQVKKIATLCRGAVSECDLPEYCDGVSEFCPADVSVLDGVDCGRGRAYCYGGQCRSHSDQCRLLWGPSGKMSDVRCYEQNNKGNVNGNCGYNRLNQTYIPCSKEDVLCGMLHCTHLNERLEFGMESAAILARSFISVRGKTLTCRSAIVDLGLFNMDPGLAPNGARCGDGKACLSQRCVPINEIKQHSCLYDCNNNGICNSRGNCHCIAGYGPPHCDCPGQGGSIDSGPATDPDAGYPFMVAMYVIFLCIVSLSTVAAFAIFYFRRHLKTWWIAKARRAAIKSRAKQASERKNRPSSKFNFDRDSLRTLEISSPIPQNLVVNTVATVPRRSTKGALIRASLRNVEISAPIPQSSTNNLANARPIPIRSAPRPSVMPQRTPSWTPGTNGTGKSRTAALRAQGNGVPGRPLSIPTARPNCPPPCPPVSKATNSTTNSNQLLSVKNSSGPSSNISHPERADTPNSAYYDDCQTLDFSDTPLAFVHASSDKNHSSETKLPLNAALKEDSTRSLTHNTPTSSARLGSIHYFRPSSNINSNSVTKPLFPRTIGQTSLVSSLAQKFECKPGIANTDRSSIFRPPFKSRPLPPRPDEPSLN